MKLNAREQAWIDKRKKDGKMAKSHPTYNAAYVKWGKQPKLTFEERMQQVEAIDPYSEEGIARQESSAKVFGRGWQIFQGVEFRSIRKEKTWIEQFYVESQRVKNKKRNRCLV